MPVGLVPPDPAALFPVPGVRLGATAARIRKADRLDLLVVALDAGTRVAGVFTRNRFCAAPVSVAKEHLAGRSEIRALVVNTGNANAGTGEEGVRRARQTCEATAQLLGCAAEAVLPFSTGVVMESLPVERIVAGLPGALADLAPAHWGQAAEAIMTTDTCPKAISRRIMVDGVPVTITGISKGAGMIRPNMATMLGFIATDAPVGQVLLDEWVREVADQSFNCITVDGDTSTNDSLMLIATGRAPLPPIEDRRSPACAALRQAILDVAVFLAQAIVRDGEGATKFITVRVEGGKSREECRQVAFAVAHSPLVKTAFFASDPNLGRILAAIGYAGVEDLDVGGVRVHLGDVLVAERGARSPAYREEDGQRAMAEAEIVVAIYLGRGSAQATVWTCDFSYDYVRINADYRS